MKAEDKCKIAIEKGYTCNLQTGEVFGPFGKRCLLTNNGYVSIYLNIIKKHLSAHQFIFYCKNGFVPDLIDHIDKNKLNNSIDNLRIANKSINRLNMDCKGYTFDKSRNKYMVKCNNKFLGRFDTKEEARKVYLQYKKILGY